MPLTGLEKVFGVLKLWETDGYVIFDSKCSEAIPKYLPGYTNRLFAKELYEHVVKSGDLHERAQKPDDGWETPYFYYSIPTINGQKLYVKMILTEDEDEIEDCVTMIVSLHPPTFLTGET